MQVFSCEICEIFKNTYFEEDPRTAASVWQKNSENSYDKSYVTRTITDDYS